MVVRIAVHDATAAKSLAQSLFGAFDAEAISLAADAHEVRVVAERDSDRLVVEVLAAVEEWLSKDGVRSAELRIGERSYTLSRSDQAESGERERAS